MSSGRLFRSECFSAFRICSFSVRQRLHRLDSLLYDCALLAIDQLMVNGFLFLFNYQMCLELMILKGFSGVIYVALKKKKKTLKRYTHLFEPFY